MLLAFFFTANLCLAQSPTVDFVHPGSLSSQDELDFVKRQIMEQAQPWKGEFDRIKESAFATRQPHGLSHINSTNNEGNISKDDATAAYTQALLWYFANDESYAKSSVAILNSWAKLEGFNSGSDQDRLHAGWIGAVFAQAAEIMRSYPGWERDDIKSMQAMFERAFYPQLNTASSWNGNVDLTQIDAMMGIAVFNEDSDEFHLALKRLRLRNPAYFYLSNDDVTARSIKGDGNDLAKFWSHPTKWLDGLTQESCRDGGHHSQFGLGSALHAAEIAWHQGVDIYGENQQRYTAAMELLAKQLLSDSMLGTCKNDEPTRSRFDCWQIGYNHYHNRVGLELPNTKQLIEEQIRPRAPRAILNLTYETLTHTDLPTKIGATADSGVKETVQSAEP